VLSTLTAQLQQQAAAGVSSQTIQQQLQEQIAALPQQQVMAS